MSLNVENFFVKSDDANKIAELVEEHWRNPLPP